MNRKAVSGIMLTLLLIGMLAVSLNVQPAKAEGTIYIRANGNVDPPTANITTADNVTYTFSGNNYDFIVVERSDIVINGNGYTLQGPESGNGFTLSGVNNVTIQNTNIKHFYCSFNLSRSSQNFVCGNHMNNAYCAVFLLEGHENSILYNTVVDMWLGVSVHSSHRNKIADNDLEQQAYGIDLQESDNNSIDKNNVTASSEIGIRLYSSSNNTISHNRIVSDLGRGVFMQYSNDNILSENTIENRYYGIRMVDFSFRNVLVANTIKHNTVGLNPFRSDYTTVYHNNFINNTNHVFVQDSPGCLWDNGYPDGGNYWSDYTGADANGDGIGDMPYLIDANNTDRYPLMHPWSSRPVLNINTGLDYNTIQEAIDAPETLGGHMIFVESGIYNENVVVNKAVSLVGENMSSTYIEAGGTVVTITANDVVLSEFFVWNGGIGIELSGSGCTISNNFVVNNNWGIWLENSNDSVVSDNYVMLNNNGNIYVGESQNNTILRNFIGGVEGGFICKYGIHLFFSPDTKISQNTISMNQEGIRIEHSLNCLIDQNNITLNSEFGLWFIQSHNNTVSRNTVTNTAGHFDTSSGVYFLDSGFNSIVQNNIARYFYGLQLSSSSGNLIIQNNITHNNYGITISYSYPGYNNTIYHNNFLDNIIQAETTDFPNNIWDDGYPSGGNYWSDYTSVDANGDGIGDTPYVIDEDNQDNYPLMNTYGSIRNLDTNLTYLSIQSAIDTPETLDGHTIFVDEGIYYEHVVVNKSLSLVGENKFTTIIDGNYTGNVMNLTASNINIEGFTIQKSGDYPNSGIYVSSNSSNISHSIVANIPGISILLFSSSNNTINQNNMINNGYGVYLDVSSNSNVVSGNNITNNDQGVKLRYSSNNTISGNKITNNTFGITLYESYNNTISGNNITNNDHGISLYKSSNNTVSGNNITNNDWEGVELEYSSSNTISGNNITNSSNGVIIYVSSNNNVNGNNVTNNEYGIRFLYSSSSNIFYHNNFIDNTQQVKTSGYAHFWDNGYPSGGNYWDDYTGIDSYTGPCQNETGGDGMGDTPYMIDDNNADSYPLVSLCEYWSNPLSGDINKDMKVNYKDLFILSSAYGSIPEDRNWNLHADINSDDEVNYKDLFILASNYGEEWIYP